MTELASINFEFKTESQAHQAPAGAEAIAQDVWGAHNLEGLNIGLAKGGYDSSSHSGMAGVDLGVIEFDFAVGGENRFHFSLMPDDKLSRGIHRGDEYIMEKIANASQSVREMLD